MVRFFAEGAFGQARTGLAGGYELTGELDEVRGNLGVVVEDGRLAEGDLIIEIGGFIFVDSLVDRFTRIDGVCVGQRSWMMRNLISVADGKLALLDWRRDFSWRVREGRLWRGGGCFGRELVEFEEELILSFSDGAGAAGCYFGGGLGLVDGALGFCGEEVAIALGVGVALGDRGGDAGGTGFDGDGRGDVGDGGTAGWTGAAGAMGREALGHLLPEGKGGGFGFGGRFVQRAYFELCRGHCVQT